MLDFNIADTRAGQELIDIGKRKGKREGKLEGKRDVLISILKNRFGEIPINLEKELPKSKINTLDHLANSIFNFKELRDVELWWSIHGQKKAST